MAISEDQASQLQREILTLAHKLKTGSYIDRSSIKQAADMVASQHGYKSGLEIQGLIGSKTHNLNKSKPNANGSKIERIASEIVRLAESGDGMLPHDWKLANELGCEPGDVRHARKLLVEKYRWTVRERSKGRSYEAPAAAAVQSKVNGKVNGKVDAEAIQGTLLVASPDKVQLAILNELRQIRGLMAKMVGVWS